MSIVLVVGLCPSLAYAGEGTNSKALVLATATLAPASTPSSMKFTPVGQYKVVENTHGVTTKDDQWGTYYYYDSPEFNEGDQITLADDTGEERTYTYTRDGEDGYFIDGDERLGNEELYWLSLQEGPVKAGKAVSFELHYQDLSTTVDMTITEDPVKSIEFVPAEGRDLSVLEEADGSWDPEEAVFCYQFPEFQEGDSIVAKGEDNEIVYTYSWSDAEYAFVSGENTLDIFGLQDGQLLESAPGYATFTLEYRDPGHDNVERKFEVQVAIEHNPVKSVTFKAAGERAFTTIEGIGGDEGFACDEDGNESSYYRYNFPGFLEGDTLEVEGDEGYAGTYKYGYDEEDTPVFRTEAGNTICQGEGHGDIRDGGSDQDGDITAPKTVTFSFYYMGREFKIPVEIAVNPVKSVEFTPAPGHEFSLVAETGGYEDKLEYENGSVTRYCRYMFPGFKEGDTLAVTGDEGYGGAYVYGYDDEGTPAFRSEAGKAIYFDWNDDGIRDGGSDQTGPIDAPNEVTFSFYYMGREFKIPVAITVNPVESVEFVPADGAEFTVVEGRDGYDQPTWDEDGVETGSYFKYWFPGFHDGDRVSVKGDASIAGTYSYIGPGESTSSWLFGNDGKTIVIERDASDQFEDVSAESGEPINFTLSYMGRTFTVPVKVVENPVKSISFIPVDDEEFTITEGIGYTEETLTNDDGEQITFLRYSFPGFREGDSVVVEGSNGDKVTYVYGYDSEDNPAFRNGDDVFAVSSEGSDQVGEVACGETITFV